MAEDAKVDDEHNDGNERDNRCTFGHQLVSGLGDRHASVQRPMLDAALEPLKTVTERKEKSSSTSCWQGFVYILRLQLILSLAQENITDRIF